MAEAAEVQRGFPYLSGVARRVHEERQYAARNHGDCIENVDRANAHDVSQAGQEHGGGLRKQRCAYYGRQDRTARPHPCPVTGPVGEGV